jgi:hypothetical protein
MIAASRVLPVYRAGASARGVPGGCRVTAGFFDPPSFGRAQWAIEQELRPPKLKSGSPIELAAMAAPRVTARGGADVLGVRTARSPSRALATHCLGLAGFTTYLLLAAAAPPARDSARTRSPSRRRLCSRAIVRVDRAPVACGAPAARRHSPSIQRVRKPKCNGQAPSSRGQVVRSEAAAVSISGEIFRLHSSTVRGLSEVKYWTFWFSFCARSVWAGLPNARSRIAVAAASFDDLDDEATTSIAVGEVDDA